MACVLDLDKVPTRETGMTAYEMMLSESQERMLMVLKPEKEKEAEDIFRKWGLDFAIVGETTPDKRFVVRIGGQEMANLPIKELGDEAPVYDRPHTASPRLPVIDPASIEAPMAHAEALEKLMASPDLCSKRWVWEQYDHLILGNTVQRPGGDSAVVRVKEGPKGLALTTDVTPRYCEADPFEGGKQAVAEAWRNLSAVGAKPMALTDNLNFGNPERPEIMGQLVGCVQGIAAACKALEFPVVSGNVSLYNETNGRAILPTPTIGGVGLIDDFAKSASIAFKAADELIVLLGETKGWIGQSLYLRDICGREEGAPPPVDLMAERRAGDFVRGLIEESFVTAVHDLSDGGLAGRGRRDGARLRHRRQDLWPARIPHRAWLLVRRGPGALCGDDQAGAVRRSRRARPHGRRSAPSYRYDPWQRHPASRRAADSARHLARAA